MIPAHWRQRYAPCQRWLQQQLQGMPLQQRLVLASLLVLPLFLCLAGYLLQLAFANSLQASIEAQLKGRLYGLLGSAEWQQGQLWLPERLADPDLNAITSGVYAVVSRNGQLLWRSSSSQLLSPAQLLGQAEPFAPGQLRFSSGPLLRLALDVVLESSDGDQRLTFSLLQRDTELYAAVAAHRRQLAITLAILGLFLLLAQLAVMHFGLLPLKAMSRDLKRLENGKQQQLDGDYPRELRRLVANLNRLIHNQHQQQQRYRHALDDLAHSLKTPLAVLRNGLAQSSQATTAEPASQQALADLLAPTLARMEQIVGHQLSRAALAQPPLQAGPLTLLPLLERLGAALAKVYHDKGLALQFRVEASLQLAADEADLLELLGNLLDNACKYASSQVNITASELPPSAAGAAGLHSGHGLIIHIDDDGPGVAAELRTLILKRGERADTALPGQGIGLAIVCDILSSYRGQLQVSQSPLGGARFSVLLPAKP